MRPGRVSCATEGWLAVHDVNALAEPVTAARNSFVRRTTRDIHNPKSGSTSQSDASEQGNSIAARHSIQDLPSPRSGQSSPSGSPARKKAFSKVLTLLMLPDTLALVP